MGKKKKLPTYELYTSEEIKNDKIHLVTPNPLRMNKIHHKFASRVLKSQFGKEDTIPSDIKTQSLYQTTVRLSLDV